MVKGLSSGLHACVRGKDLRYLKVWARSDVEVEVKMQRQEATVLGGSLHGTVIGRRRFP